MEQINFFSISLLLLVGCIGLVYFLHPSVVEIKFYPHDFQFHFYKASGDSFKSTNYIDQEKLDRYAPLTAWIWSPFSFHLIPFFLFTLFVFFVLFGLILVRLSRHWVSVLFWLACSAPWFFIEGTLAQGVATLLLLVFVYVKTPVRLVLLCLALLTHTWGFWLLGAYWVMEIIVKTNWSRISLGVCGGGLLPAINNGKETVILGNQVNVTTSILGTKALNYGSYVYVLRWLAMFPLLPFGFMGLWKLNKTWFWFSLIVFLGAFGFLYWRIVESVMPFVVLGLTHYYKSMSKKAKVLMIFIAFGLIVIQLVHYLYTIQNFHLSLSNLFLSLPCALGLI
jgi:hypothetical protein